MRKQKYKRIFLRHHTYAPNSLKWTHPTTGESDFVKQIKQILLKNKILEQGINEMHLL